ncbi:hypothetical protein DFQ26_008441 [Actinomortierella ambigua]|nr:hypothetical protein DFQ26_008441 [Actinomortierella ambigua]
MSLWTALSGPVRRRVVVVPSTLAASSSTSASKTTIVVVDARRSFTQSRTLGRGEDWTAGQRSNAKTSSSSFSSRKVEGRAAGKSEHRGGGGGSDRFDGRSSASKRSYDSHSSQRRGGGGGGSSVNNGRRSEILDFSTRRTPNTYASSSSTSMADRFTSRRFAGAGGASTAAGAGAAAAAGAAGASHLYRRHGAAGSFLSRKADDSSDDDDEGDEDWLDRKRTPRNGVWSRSGVEAVDDADNNEDRSTLSRGQRSYDSDHDDDGEEEEDEDDDEDDDEDEEEDDSALRRRRRSYMDDDYDEDAEYERKYVHKRTRDITQNKGPQTEYLYHPNVVRPALTSGFRKIHRLYILNSYKPKIHTEIKKCLEVAERLGISPIKVDRHTLNTMAGNRPHAGIVLEAGPLQRILISKLGQVESVTESDNHGQQQQQNPEAHYEVHLKSTRDVPSYTFHCRADEPPVWVVMDEVVDPQNMGAILRSAFFLGADGVVVCEKNSAPFSPVVAKASSGAMEARRTFSVQSLIKFLQTSKENGWQVVGAHVTYGSKRTVPLHQWPAQGVDQPTVLVVGNEGHGLRKMILKHCDHYVQIPPLSPQDEVVDSLNVGTATGILLTRFMGARFAHLPTKLKKFPHRVSKKELGRQEKVLKAEQKREQEEQEEQEEQQEQQEQKVEEEEEKLEKPEADKDQK